MGSRVDRAPSARYAGLDIEGKDFGTLFHSVPSAKILAIWIIGSSH